MASKTVTAYEAQWAQVNDIQNDCLVIHSDADHYRVVCLASWFTADEIANMSLPLNRDNEFAILLATKDDVTLLHEPAMAVQIQVREPTVISFMADCSRYASQIEMPGTSRYHISINAIQVLPAPEHMYLQGNWHQWYWCDVLKLDAKPVFSNSILMQQLNSEKANYFVCTAWLTDKETVRFNIKHPSVQLEIEPAYITNIRKVTPESIDLSGCLGDQISEVSLEEYLDSF